MRIAAVILAMLLLLIGRTRVEADGYTERQAGVIGLAHKADVEHGGRVDKALVWAIADRESGLRHCDGQGRVKVSATGDHGLLQLNERGVFGNCLVNRWCRAPWMIDDAAAQVDVMLNYADVYGDLCPWNPAGNYLPGCGYGTTVRSGAARRALASSVPALMSSASGGEGQGNGLQTGDGPSRTDEVRDR